MMRRLISDIADIADEKVSGKRYHYSEPANKRVANAVFRFWGRMIAIGVAFSLLSSVAMIYVSWSQQKAEEAAAAAEAEKTKKRNPWALEK